MSRCLLGLTLNNVQHCQPSLTCLVNNAESVILASTATRRDELNANSAGSERTESPLEHLRRRRAEIAHPGSGMINVLQIPVKNVERGGTAPHSL